MPKNYPLLLDIGHGLSMLLDLPSIPSWDTAERPKEPRPGTFGFNSKTNSLEYWDGTDWYRAPLREE